MYMHTSKHDFVILVQPTQTGCGLQTPSTNHRLVSSLQHEYPYDLMNMK